MISGDFVEEDANAILPDSPKSTSSTVKEINKKISNDNKIQESLRNREFISHIVEVGNQKYNVVFLPLIGMNDTLEGYLLSYSKADDIPSFIVFFPYLVLIVVLGTLLVLVLLKVIKDKTEELSYEKNWLNQINDSLYEGLYVTDKNSNIEYINPMACEILGYKKEELIGKNAHYLFHYHDKNNHLKQEECTILKGILTNGRFNNKMNILK